MIRAWQSRDLGLILSCVVMRVERDRNAHVWSVLMVSLVTLDSVALSEADVFCGVPEEWL